MSMGIWKRGVAALFALVIFMGAGEAARAEESVYSEDEKQFVEDVGVLKVGYVADRVPISFENERGELDGVSREIFDLIAQNSGLQFDYVELPQGAVTYDYLFSQGFDLVTSVEYNKQNLAANGIIVSHPYLSSKKVIIGRKDLVFQFDKHLKVAVVAGSQTIKKVLKEQYPNFEPVDYKTVQDCFDAVEEGKADVLIQNQYVAEFWIHKPKYEKLQVIPVIGLQDELCFSAVTPLDNADPQYQERARKIVAIINKAILQMSEDEVTNFIIRAMVEDTYEYTVSDFLYSYRYLIMILAVALLIVGCLVFIIVRLYIKTARARAEAAAKGEFLSAMSHEIKTPLNGIIGLNYLMSQNMGDASQLETYLKQSSTAAKYLLSMVNNILDMSKLQERSVTLEERQFSLEEVLSAIFSVSAERMKKKEIRFWSEQKLPCPQIVADEARIEQIIMNLLDNAYKFTPEKGEVVVRVSQQAIKDSWVKTWIEVSDSGCGMSEEFQKKMFRTFAQEKSGVSKGDSGIGLGLSISYMLAKLMNGDLRVESTEGEGSRFIFEFLAKEALEAAKDVQEKDAASEDAAAGQPAADVKILVAEDNELNREILTELLQGEGYHVAVAEDGEKAVEAFRKSAVGEFDVILMDLIMPRKDGFLAAQEIRAMDRPDASTVRIYACSANSKEKDISKVYLCGMDGFISKPLNIEKLLQHLKEDVART